MPLSPVQEEYSGMNDVDVDLLDDWDDFDRLLSEYNVRRRNIPQSPLLARRFAAEEPLSTFYPCPAPAAPQDPHDPYSEYVATDSVST